MSKKIYTSEDIKKAVNSFCADEEWSGRIFNPRRVAIENLTDETLELSESEDFAFRPYELKAFGNDGHASYNMVFNANNSHFVLTNEPTGDVTDYSESWQQLLKEKSAKKDSEVER